MRPSELKQALKSQAPAGVYVLAATDADTFDTYLADACLQEIIERAEVDDASRVSFDGEDFDVGAFLAAVQTIPMFGGVSVVICRRAEALTADAQAALAEPLAQVPETTVVVLIARKFDGRLKFTKQLKKCAAWVDVTTPSDPATLAAWVQARFTGQGKRIDSRLALDLAQRSGGIDRLARLVDQVALYLGQAEDVTPEAVAALWRSEPEDNVFAITDAISAHDGPAALRAFGEATRAGTHHLQLLGLIEGAIRRLSGIRQGMDAGLSNDEIAERLGVKRGAVHYQRQKAEGWTAEGLRALHRDVLALEYQTKSGGGDPRLRMEAFLARACAS